MALHILIGRFYIPMGYNLHIHFSFLVGMLIALIYDFKTLIVYGLIEDNVGFFLAQSSTYFPGYTLSTILGLLIYRFFLHKGKISLTKIFIAKLCVNVLVNILLGSLWSFMLYHKGYLFYLFRSLSKNFVMLPLEAFMFYGLFKLLYPLLIKYQLIKKEPTKIDI